MNNNWRNLDKLKVLQLLERLMYITLSIAAIITVCMFWLKYKDSSFTFDPVIRWHDETVEWLAEQEILKTGSWRKMKRSDAAKITKLTLNSDQIKNVKDLKYFPNLKELTIDAPNLTNLKPIKNLHHLEKLVISGEKIKTLKPLKKLNVLDLTLEHITVQSIEPLCQMERLKNLKLVGFPSFALQPMKKIENLESLALADISFDKGEITDYLPHVNELTLQNVRTAEAMSLPELANYRRIELKGVKVRTLELISTNENLESLYLEDMDFSELSNLVLPKKLKQLTVRACQLKDMPIISNRYGLLSLDLSDVIFV